MAYTFEKITEIPQADFQSILNDCYSSIRAGNGMYFPPGMSLIESKLFIHTELVSNLTARDITVKVSDSESKVIGFFQGDKEAGVYKNIMALWGKDSTNSKAYLYSSTFRSDIVSFLESENCLEADILVVPNSRNHTDLKNKNYLSKKYNVSEVNFVDLLGNFYVKFSIGLKELEEGLGFFN